MECPQCRTGLRSLEYEGITVDCCETCGGEFLDADELGQVVSAREARFSPELRQRYKNHQPAFGVPVQQKSRPICCPKCGGPMRVINYCGDSAIFINRCEECEGFWLDSDELEHIQIFQEEWEARAPRMLQEIAGQLEQARRETAESTNRAFAGSRFAFLNALINRFLDAA